MSGNMYDLSPALGQLGGMLHLRQQRQRQMEQDAATQAQRADDIALRRQQEYRLAAHQALQEKGMALDNSAKQEAYERDSRARHRASLARGMDPKAADMDANIGRKLYGLPPIKTKMGLVPGQSDRYHYLIKHGDEDETPYDPVGEKQSKEAAAAAVVGAIMGRPGYAPQPLAPRAVQPREVMLGPPMQRPGPQDLGAFRAAQAGGFIPAEQLPDTDLAVQIKYQTDRSIPMRSQYDDSAVGLNTEQDWRRIREEQQRILTDQRDPYSAAFHMGIDKGALEIRDAYALAQGDEKRANALEMNALRRKGRGGKGGSGVAGLGKDYERIARTIAKLQDDIEGTTVMTDMGPRKTSPRISEPAAVERARAQISVLDQQAQRIEKGRGFVRPVTPKVTTGPTPLGKDVMEAMTSDLRRGVISPQDVIHDDGISEADKATMLAAARKGNSKVPLLPIGGGLPPMAGSQPPKPSGYLTPDIDRLLPPRR